MNWEQVYYISEILSATEFKVTDTLGWTVIWTNTTIDPNMTMVTLAGTVDLVDGIGSMEAIFQVADFKTPSMNISVEVNGTTLWDNEYAVDQFTTGLPTLNIYSHLNAGDIVSASGATFTMAQTLTTETPPRTGVRFGQSLDTTNFAGEILVGAPFELNTQLDEGAVFRFTDAGRKYGVLTGTTECNVGETTFMLNGYAVMVQGMAIDVASQINAAQITNVMASTNIVTAGNFVIGSTYVITSLGTTDFTLLGAYANTVGEVFTATGAGDGTGTASDNFLTIQLIDQSLAIPNNKLALTICPYNGDTNWGSIADMGIPIYTQTQVIECPHTSTRTQFGSVVKFNEFDSFVASAPAGTRFSATTFDFTDDELDNDTLFDNNATRWVDTFANAGAVYMFDYLGNYNESLTNIGKFVYAQSVNDNSLEYGAQPYYGQALDFNDNVVMVGTPGFMPGVYDGQVVKYTNSTGIRDWSVYRQSGPIVDIDRIQDIQLYSASTNMTLDNLDYMDPLQGKILGAVRENIDVVSNSDPAGYNSPSRGALVWGADKVGQLWFNTTNTRFVNYHQEDVVYNSKYWGAVFPGSNVSIFSWIVSNTPPSQYPGPGTPYDTELYTVEQILNPAGQLIPQYFFWARNTNIVFTAIGKTLSDTILESYVAAPIKTGISFFAPIRPDVYALYNSSDNINANDTVLHIGYLTGTNDDVPHTLFNLIRAGYADDFLPGLPNSTSVTVPESLYNKLLDSMCGVDEAGSIIPDPYLPLMVQTGTQTRPRQSFFYNRFGALKNYLTYANEVLSLYPIAESRSAFFLRTTGITNPSTIGNPTWLGTTQLFYDTQAYWSYVNWWAVGYNDNTKAALQVPMYADLATINAVVGLIVSVQANGIGKSETYVYTSDGSWTRIGLQDGTIAFNATLWDYATYRLGFGDNFFDTTVFDLYPSEETRQIVRALNEEIYSGELLIHRNKSLILLFEYIQSETGETQNYLPWLNKTSFIDVDHTIRELLPISVYQSDNQAFLSGYINEVKPYHVVIKEFVFKYTGSELYGGNITDFDLPAQYNTSVAQFISPQLVYSNSTEDSQYLLGDPIWQTQPYIDWYDNRGLSLTGVSGYPITVTSSFIALNSFSLAVSNPNGFPVSGVIRIGNEILGYSSVDVSLNTLNGLTRGVNGTPIESHFPGTQIFMDLPAVLLLNSGRAYENPPRVTAVVDTTLYPAPIRDAILAPVMNLDKIQSITVVDPGEGYMSLPEIVIEPSITITFSSENVNLLTGTIELNTPVLVNGDLIKYVTGDATISPGGLDDNQYYYVGVLQTIPTFVIALYNNYDNSLADINRVILLNAGAGANNYLNVLARASCISSAAPIRENQLSIKFDRTSYDTKVIDWRESAFYGSFFAGDFGSGPTLASSGLLLDSVFPNIDSVSSSSQAAIFELESFYGTEQISWSGRTRSVAMTYSGTDWLTITPSTANTATMLASSISGTTLTVGLLSGGPIAPGMLLTGGNPDNPLPVLYIVSNISGTGSGSTWLVSDSCLFSNITVIGNTIYPRVGPTLGFYIGMPIKFLGAVGSSGIAAEVVYYVAEIVSDVYFTISETVGGPVFALSDSTISPAGLLGYVGEVIYRTFVSINYPGISNVTQTAARTNFITVPITPGGNAGTAGFYPGLAVFFVGEVFGNIIENEPYYVTTVVDAQTFTISKNMNPIMIHIYETVSGDNFVKCPDTWQLTVGDPIVFNDMVTSGSSTLDFGNIQSGVTYYVNSIVDYQTFTIAIDLYSDPLVLADAIGSCLMTDQKDTLPLANATGSMTINAGLPVSPGQINGQLVSFYPTSDQFYPVYPDSDQPDNLVLGLVVAPVAGVNQLSIWADSRWLSDAYVNMCVISNVDYYNIVAGVQYYITEIGIVNTSVIATGAYGLTCLSTDGFYINMPIVFSGMSIGGILLGTTYHVATIDLDGVTFTIQELVPSVAYGTMYATGQSYIVVSESMNGPTFALDPTGWAWGSQATLTQYVPYYAEFDISFIRGGYRTKIVYPGEGYAVGNSIVIKGNQIGGHTPANDLTYTIESISKTTTITATWSAANSPYGYDGIVCLSNYELNSGDPIIFTGAAIGNIVPNTVYYVANIDSNGVYISVSDTYGGANLEMIDGIGTMLLTDNGIGPITLMSAVGIPNEIVTQYYLKVVGANECELFSDPKMTQPVNVASFVYKGIASTGVVRTNWYYNTITISDPALFSINDPVVFTGAVPADIGVDIGVEYYIYETFRSYVSGTLDYESTPANTVEFTDGWVDAQALTVNDQVFINEPLGNLLPNVIYYVVQVVDDNHFRISETLGGPVLELVNDYMPDGVRITDLNCIRVSDTINGTPVNFQDWPPIGTPAGVWTMSKAGDYAVLPEPFYFDQSIVRFNHQLYQCIISNNDPTFVFGKWELLRSEDIKLNALDRIFGYYQPTVNMPGLDFTQLVNGVSYPNGTYAGNAFDPNQQFTLDTILQDQPFTTSAPAEYVVQGDPFTAGYGPEELLPGIISDNLTMIVTTRPGTNWPVTQYANVGYKVVSLELTPAVSDQVLYNFDGAVQTPAQIAVFVIDRVTGLSRSLYLGIDYVMTDGRTDLMVENGELILTEGSETLLTEDSIETNSSLVGWLTKTIKLTSPLDFVTVNNCEKLRVDVYEVGNGDQLEKSNTQTNPLTYNSVTGFNEILLNCNYSDSLNMGSGLIRPGTEPVDSTATVTDAPPDNTITCTNIDAFILNGPVTFQGNVFGGVAEDTTYYVKSISLITEKITISTTRVSGIAGDTFPLSADTGTMTVIIQVGEGLPWTPPIVLHNGNPLVFGSFSLVTETEDNIIACNSTAAMIVGCTVVFDSNIFGGILVAHQPYTVFSIVNENEFTLEDPNNPGNELVLPTAFGGSVMMINDYAFAVADNGISAKMILAASYNPDVDYLSYSVFGETLPEQYGYTVPGTEVFTVQVAEVAFRLSNYMGGSNPINAIVEHNGLRLVNIADYVIDPDSNLLTLNFVPTSGDTVAVTSYNLTDRQYLHTMYGGPFGGNTSVNLIVGSTTHAAIPYDALTTAGDFIIGQTYIINSVGTTDFMAIGAASNTVSEVFIATGNGTGNGTALVGYDEGSFSEYLNWLTLDSGSTTGLNINDPITFSAPTLGGIVAGQVYHVVGILSSTEFTISVFISGEPMNLTSETGSMLGFVNPATVSNIVDISNTITPPLAITNVTATTFGTDVLTCNSTVGFSEGSIVLFEVVSGPGLGGVLVNGTVYYVLSVINGTDFTISETLGGTPFTITASETGIMTAIVGGTPAVRVTTGIPHVFAENDLIRIDGTVGSTQLNNNAYYVKIISPTVFDLYFEPYTPVLGEGNLPVTGIYAYVSSGYTWIDGTFTLITGMATATQDSLGSDPDSITCPTTELVVDTPVLFSGNTLGGISAGTTYYVKEIFSETNFTISETYQGPVFALTNDTGLMGVTQWDQSNVDRLWVTVNGYRLPSSSLKANPYNNISILTTIVPGDVVVITSMMPTPSPNELIYIQNVNENGEGSVYRAGPQTRTWLTEPLLYTDEVIYVNDLSKLTHTIVQNVTAPAEVDGLITIGLMADKRIISQVIVYNDTTSTLVDTANYFIGTLDTAPVVNITGQVSIGDILVVTTIEGNLIYVFGEQIRFTIVDFAAKSLSGLQRGTNGTGIRSYVPVNTTVFGLLSGNRMPDPLYAQTWNEADYPDNDGDIDGGPLQISTTAGAIFLTMGANQ